MNRTVFASAFLLIALSASAEDFQNGKLTRMAGMQLPAMVTRESSGIPHVFAFTMRDAAFVNGWLHGQDRFFQMDTNRRIASGTLAELLGTPALGNDVQLRTFGLKRTAEATLPLLSADARTLLEAYALGVNTYISSHPLPPEYGLLEVTTVPPWAPVDSIAIGKLIAFGLSFDLDVDATVALITYQTVGKAVGFDGSIFFANDTWRLAPFSKAATIPDATGAGAAEPLRTGSSIPTLDTDWLKPEAIEMAKQYLEQIRDVPSLAAAIDPDKHAGSNEWAIAPRNSTTGNSLIANDPHLSLSSPPNFYPISLRVPGRVNVAGMGFPGTPFVIQGQNERIAWGSTVHPMDVTDIYQEQFVPDATAPSGFASLYNGAKETILVIPQVFRANNIGNGVKNDLSVVTAGVPPATLIIPRHGPIISPPSASGVALSIQYTGFYPTHELEAFLLIDQAKNVDDFKAALQLFDVGSQNFVYGDVDGNIAYFTSAELPLREDLQAGKINGVPPYFIRNGQGGNEWIPATTAEANRAIPYQILPYAEMPQVLNPSNGWFVNANNDPTGGSLDNNPLNTLRAGGGILYLNPGYDGFRAGRITQLVRQKLAGGGKISPDDMKAIQADTALIDAQVFVPYIVAALDNAKKSSNTTLTQFGASTTMAAAIQRLAAWNFTTPTGIPQGYDASDADGALSTPTQAEIDNSVAATIYAAWRSKFIANTIDAVLGLASMPLPPHQQTLSALRYHLENFSTLGGIGASGVSIFVVPGVADAATRRDIVILKSLSDGLQMLSSSAFAPAFNSSTNLGDYQWGKLHRVVFSHLMGAALFSPGAIGGLPPGNSIPALPGVSVDGGYSTVDVGTHNPRASTVNGFMYSSAGNRRYVGDMRAGAVQGQSSLPGGVSGIQTSPWFTNLLMPWLTNETFPVTADTSPRLPFLH